MTFTNIVLNYKLRNAYEQDRGVGAAVSREWPAATSNKSSERVRPTAQTLSPISVHRNRCMQVDEDERFQAFTHKPHPPTPETVHKQDLRYQPHNLHLDSSSRG